MGKLRLKGRLGDQKGGSGAEILFLILILLLVTLAGATAAWGAFFDEAFDNYDCIYGNYPAHVCSSDDFESDEPYVPPEYTPPPTPDLSFLTPSPSPSPTFTPTPSPTPAPEPTPTSTPEPSPTATATATPTPTPGDTLVEATAAAVEEEAVAVPE